MSKLFISYRRQDSADVTGRLCDHLKRHFGPAAVFMDVEDMPFGLDFRRHLSERVGQCDVLLAVIGDQWLPAVQPHGQDRPGDSPDWVRIEVEAALARDIPVVPVLVGQAALPDAADLPGGLQELAHRHAAAVRSGEDFHGHVERLIRGLERLLARKQELQADVQKAMDIAPRDPEMGRARARRALERVLREVYERRYQEPPGTRPVEALVQRLVRDGNLPDRLAPFVATICKLGQLGTPGAAPVPTAEAQASLMPLEEVLKWYFAVEQPDAVGQAPPPMAMSRPVESAPAGRPRAIVPKGLRPFDAQDADFFLDLLPGPRDRDGLPEGLRFWKHRIEARDELTFTVGVLYGPSGCGKSSLVKAGLLPRLASHVVPVYAEATAADTEARLLQSVRRRCTGLPSDLDLTGTVAALRQGTGLAPGQKVLFVVDQFEQWLHAQRGQENAGLVQALRQCDGERVQAVLLVRDDFWLAVSRFMQALRIELVQGQNLALVDLFDLAHARNVLAAFGRAFGRLPPILRKEQEVFLDQAVEGLSQDGRVISVRLALFAEMVKGKPWTPATLKEVGGAAGIGVAFLEETFSASLASPRQRRHQQAARSVLQALLPEQGTDIKGNMQSYAKLLTASGYGRHPWDFEELLRLLDGEVRLITPTEPAGAEVPGEVEQAGAGEQYYQLTHDYLVPSLREWLTRKQKETRRGRAELLLADRATAWNARPENHHLPAWWEWANIRLFTHKKGWVPSQRRMMRQATRYHAVHALLVALLLILTGWGGYEGYGRLRAQALRDRLLDANTTDVPAIVRDMAPYRRWLDPLLREAHQAAEANGEGRKHLHTSLALLPVDPGQVDFLHQRLLTAAPNEVLVLREALAPHKEDLLPKLWQVAEQPARGQESQRLRAACALAGYDPTGPRWANVQDAVANDLVAVPAVYLAVWMDGLRPVRGKLVTPLTAIFRDPQRHETERSLATAVLADYAADQPDVLADLVLDADEKAFAVLYPKLRAHGTGARTRLHGEIDRQCASDAPPEARERLAKRQANAAVALLRLGRPDKVWPLLKHTPDPRVRSYLIHRLAPLGAKVGALVKRLDEEPDITIRRALILSLGEYDEETWSSDERGVLVKKMQDLYRTADDSGLHAATEWLLRQWKEERWLRQTNEAWANDSEQKEKRLERIRQVVAQEKEKALPQWYIGGQGQTMVLVPSPAEFTMGSPPTEQGRFDDENQHRRRIPRTFAIAAKPVTVREYLRFDQSYDCSKKYARQADCPVHGTDWYVAAAYCNWLSKREDIPEDQWCYKPDPQGQVKMRLKPTYLSLTGYRMPTEAEWEYACRAGAGTSRCYGESEELLGKYGWHLHNSGGYSWPVGSRKPNDWGLFDMHGNVWCWCPERYQRYPQQTTATVVEDIEDMPSTSTQDNRVLRGGSFNARPWNVRCANRYSAVPATHDFYVGFRVARTIR